MSSRIFSAFNGHAVTTAAPVKVAITGSTILSLMQIQTAATTGALEVIEWGISFDGYAAAQPGVVELIDTAAINATVTTYAAADIVKLSQAAGGQASTVVLGASASGFTASAEGTITTGTRQLDTQLLPPTAPYIKQFPLERGPSVLAGENLRVRVTFPNTVNALCYIVWAE